MAKKSPMNVPTLDGCRVPGGVIAWPLNVGGRLITVLGLAALSLALVAGCRREESAPPYRSSSQAPTMVPPLPPVFESATPEQLSRKARSEAILRAANVRVNASLPVIASESEAAIRGKDEIVDRAIALLIVAVKGEGLDQATVDLIRSKYTADTFFSPKEKVFVTALAPSRQDRAEFAWRYECLGVLHWALGFVEKLDRPFAIVDAGKMVSIVKDRGATAYRAAARVRTPAEILDEADLIYRYDWACVDARGRPQSAQHCDRLRGGCRAAPRPKLAVRLPGTGLGRR